MRAEIQLKNLHILAWWGWGYDPSLDICTVDLKSQTRCSSTQLSHNFLISLHSAQQCSDNRQVVSRLCRLFTFCLLTQATKVDPLLLQVGSEEGGHCYSVADEIKRPPHPPAALPAMLHTLNSHIPLLDRSSVHSTALCHASLTDTMPKITSFNSSLVNKRAFATLKQNWVFNSC